MKKTLKLGILSDSHTKTILHEEAINHLIDLGAEYLLHAGDIMLEEHLQILENTKLPYVCVYGNNDTSLISLHGKYNIFQEPYYLKIQKLKIKIMHLPLFMSPDVNIVISGHTHVFESSMRGETLFINPGEVCARNKFLTECAMVEISGEDLDEYKVIHYFRELNNFEWTEREINL